MVALRVFQYFLIFALVAFFFYSAPSYSARKKPRLLSAEDEKQIKSSIEKIIGSVKGADIAVWAESLSTGETLVEKNADKKLIPASVNKVITAYTALKRLKPNATFKTYLLTTGTVRNQKLLGDLYLRGGGDPSLVSERLWMLVNEFVRKGVKTITGNIITDSSYFDMVKNPESRPKYLKDQAYNAPVGGLSFNFNTTTIYVQPNELESTPPLVYTDPENSYVEVVNQAKTVASDDKNTLKVSRTDYVKGDVGDTVLLRGDLPIGAKELHFYRNIVNPALYTGHMFKTFLEQRSIKVMGNVVEGITPPDAKLLLEFDSLPLWQVIWGMNKFSNNFVADQLTKKIGAEILGPPGTMEKGIQVIEETLEPLGIRKGTYTVVDGSGLTRKTLVTARQIGTILKSAQDDFSISSEFIASLGIAGEDGTLKRRFSDTEKKMLLRAKTGTLDGVSSLAGYLTSEYGEPIVFAILANDSKGRSLSTVVDSLATELYRFSRKSK